jgi:hypothetical protein
MVTARAQEGKTAMTESVPGMPPGEQHLMTLRGELVRRGVSCDLQDVGGEQGLAVWCPGQSTAADEHIDSVAVSFIRGGWWYCWPQVTPISPVARVSRAAEAIISELSLGGGDTGEAGEVADLAVRRMLRQARLDIFRPQAPGAASARLAAVDGPAPGGGCQPAGPHGRRAGVIRPDGTMPPGGPLQAAAAGLAIAGFGVDVADRRGDGQPAVLAVTSPVTGASAEVTAHGAELELRCWSGPTSGGLITAQVTAVLTASARDDTPGGPLTAQRQPKTGPGERRVPLAPGGTSWRS